MAAGSAVIVSDLQCFNDYLEDGVTGLQFDHRGADPAARLAAKLALLIAEPERLQKIADAGRRAILKHIGNALLVQHRVSGRVAVAEKPDVVWDRQDLERLYARLQDEYELKERAEGLSRKLTVIADTAEVLADIIDTRRSLRLEIIIVVLIAVELILAGYQIWR